MAKVNDRNKRLKRSIETQETLNHLSGRGLDVTRDQIKSLRYLLTPEVSTDNRSRAPRETEITHKEITASPLIVG